MDKVEVTHREVKIEEVLAELTQVTLAEEDTYRSEFLR